MAKKILIVDDEPNIIKVITMRIKTEGYDISVANDGESALAAVEKNKPDLIIMDVMMPPPNGYQVCRTLKDDAKTRSIPVILLTAKNTDSDKFWGEESGADAYVTKPYNPDELVKTIKQLLQA